MAKGDAVRPDEIKPALEEIVEEKLIDLLGDPDADLKLKPAVMPLLKKSLSRKSKGISMKEAAGELGLNW